MEFRKAEEAGICRADSWGSLRRLLNTEPHLCMVRVHKVKKKNGKGKFLDALAGGTNLAPMQPQMVSWRDSLSLLAFVLKIFSFSCC